MRRGLRLTGVGAAISAFAVVGYAAAQGCGGPGAGPPADAGSDAVAETGGDSASLGDAAPTDAADVVVDSGPPPPGVPTGWVPWDDYDPACRFYVPPSGDLLPPPITWEPCDPTRVHPAGMSCQQLRVEWPGGAYPTSGADLGTDIDGTPVLYFNYRTAIPPKEGPAYYAAARVDGKIRWALFDPLYPTCILGPAWSQSDGHYMWHAYGPAKNTGGALGGWLDELRPMLLDRYNDHLGHDYSAGKPGWLTSMGFDLELHSWGAPLKVTHIISPAEDDGQQQTDPIFFQDAMFWNSSTTAVNRLRVWTPTSGTQMLFGYGLATDKGVADLGTDGKDMVWLEGTGRTGGLTEYPDEAFWTAPYTTDPATFAATRRKLTAGYIWDLGSEAIAVGCGHAAYWLGQKSDPTGDAGIAIVRIADGHRWWIPAFSGTSWRNGSAKAVWCPDGDPAHAEVIVSVNIPPIGTTARIRIDSLGPGEAAIP